MPVQPIGGSKVYVITGSNRDPRRTSTGQSWANLVTQQKYRLWNEAQKQAMADIQFEQMTFKQRQAIYDAQKQQLQGAIADARERANKLELKEIESAQAVKEEKIAQQNRRSMPRSVSSGTSGLPTDPIDKRINSAQIRLNSLVGTSKELNKEIRELKGPRGRNESENEDEIKRVQGDLAIIDAQKNKLASQLTSMQETREKVAKGKIKPPRAGRTVIGGGPVREATPIDYTAQIAELEAEQAALEEQLAGLEAPTLERPDLLGKTREIYTERFAPEPRKPAITPTRQAEFAAIGMEPPAPEQPEPKEEPVEEPQVSKLSPKRDNFVETMYTSKVRDENMNNIGAAQLAAETIRDLETFFPKNSQDYTDVRAEIIEAYQMKVNPKAATAIKEGEQAKPLKENEQTKLIKSLYAPEEDATPEKRQAAFDNAVKELQKKYKDDEKKLSESIAILVQLHKEGQQ